MNMAGMESAAMMPNYGKNAAQGGRPFAHHDEARSISATSGPLHELTSRITNIHREAVARLAASEEILARHADAVCGPWLERNSVNEKEDAEPFGDGRLGELQHAVALLERALFAAIERVQHGVARNTTLA
jgi:hypothetical protein